MKIPVNDDDEERLKEMHDLLAIALPQVIHTEGKNEHYIAEIGHTDATGVVVTRRVASEVLRGEWDLSNVNIQKLAERFHVPPELFSPIPQKTVDRVKKERAAQLPFQE